MATVLGPDETVPRRPFTSVKLYQSDIGRLTSMLEDLRSLMATRDVSRYQSFRWQNHGLKRRTIVCDPERLMRIRDVYAVGFFAQRRPGPDPRVLNRVNSRLISEFTDFPGILSYSSFERSDNEWTNLVIHDKPKVTEDWRAGATHARAVAELSPVYYRNVRIHTCHVPGGIIGSRWIVITKTKYWDYRAKKIWHAVRELSAPISG